MNRSARARALHLSLTAAIPNPMYYSTGEGPKRPYLGGIGIPRGPGGPRGWGPGPSTHPYIVAGSTTSGIARASQRGRLAREGFSPTELADRAGWPERNGVRALRSIGGRGGGRCGAADLMIAQRNGVRAWRSIPAQPSPYGLGWASSGQYSVLQCNTGPGGPFSPQY